MILLIWAWAIEPTNVNCISKLLMKYSLRLFFIIGCQAATCGHIATATKCLRALHADFTSRSDFVYFALYTIHDNDVIGDVIRFCWWAVDVWSWTVGTGRTASQSSTTATRWRPRSPSGSVTSHILNYATTITMVTGTASSCCIRQVPGNIGEYRCQGPAVWQNTEKKSSCSLARP